MSIISRIVKPNGDINYPALAELIDEYENKLEDWGPHLEINGKRLEEAIIEQHSWAAYYDQIRVELDSLVDFFDIELDKRAEQIYLTIKQQSGQSHSDTSIKRLILGNSKYVSLRRLRLELKDLRDRSDSISKQFYQRSFTIKNYIKVIELSAQDIVMSI